VVDDHAVVREGVRRMLTQYEDLTVIGEAATGEDALSLVERRRPDVVLMDVRMPGMGGIEACRRIRRGNPEVGVVMFTAHDDEALVGESMDAGARAFALKGSDPATLVAAIRAAGAGEAFVDPMVGAESRGRGPSVLSGRERQVLQMLADGLSNREVSERLMVSSETVKTHVKHILAKLGAEHRTQAVAIGLRQSLIR
jgi:DNA-binding NarL/FixJ family response regulator